MVMVSACRESRWAWHWRERRSQTHASALHPTRGKWGGEANKQTCLVRPDNKHEHVMVREARNRVCQLAPVLRLPDLGAVHALAVLVHVLGFHVKVERVARDVRVGEDLLNDVSD